MLLLGENTISQVPLNLFKYNATQIQNCLKCKLTQISLVLNERKILGVRNDKTISEIFGEIFHGGRPMTILFIRVYG